MAYINATPAFLGASIWSAVSATGSAILDVMVSIGKARSRAASIEAMQSMSDAELNFRFGIKRSQIAAFIFRDKLLP